MPYTATLQLRAKVQPNIKVKAQGLGEMISIRVSLGSTTFLNRGSIAFSPYSLFTFGTQGIWLDPSDVANVDWRRNLLLYSEQFDNATWVKTEITTPANVAVAPDGTMTADKFVPSTNAVEHRLQQSIAAQAGACTGTVYVKSDGSNVNKVVLYNGGGGCFAFFNISTLTTSGEANVTSSSITDVGSGWYRLQATWPATQPTNRLWVYASSGTLGISPVAGNGTDGIFIWGAQLELGTVATEYQRITDLNTEIIERFPNATMYQDSVGTVPVYAPGQPVGLRLDKSKALGLGPELVTNGDFSGGTTSGWTTSGATLSVVSGQLQIETTGAAVGFAYQSFSTIVGKSYRLDSAVNILSGTGLITVGTGPGSTVNYISATLTGTSQRTAIFTATATTTTISVFQYTATAGLQARYDNISVKELFGNHATQSVAGSRPFYGVEPAGGRRNLLTFTEQFENAIWVKQSGTTVTANQTTAPNGTATADLVVGNGASGISRGIVTISTTATNTKSIWMRGVSGGEAVVLKDPSQTIGTVTCNLTTSWQRFSLSEIQTGGFAGVWVANIPAGGIYIWGAQLELGSTATPYQRVTTDYDVTEAGVQTCHYVQYDGSDDGMFTNSIDFSYTNKMSVFTGIRKNSDATVQTFVELSAAADANNGAFYIRSPESASKYSFLSRGTGNASAIYNGSLYSAPTTNVLTAIGDISGDVANLRINGTQAVLSSTDQGTGNYGNYPLYIGRRNNASLPFNGRDYGIIIVGKLASTEEIATTEAWLASKTATLSPFSTGYWNDVYAWSDLALWND